MPRAKKETQAEITQRTMEEMQTQLAQLSQAMQGLLAQRNAATPVEEQDDEQSDHDDDANPFAVLGANQQIAQPAQLNERWDQSFKFKIQSSMAARSRKISLTGSPRWTKSWNLSMFRLTNASLS
ncbi:hypothetical protein Bca52824_051976 [Brassica carinata]|uniref:Uncharacterized protein n=1 Tax=Brassica carinata TaxID=52824 RepID=A0A8X7UKC9_BRACI|nr:hypothetical protein Bca52824_051976 [Brassica carinata]